MLFLAGVGLAALFVHVGQGSVELEGVAVVPTEPTTAKILRITIDEEQKLLKTLPVGKGLQQLSEALDEGSSDSLQSVRGDFLRRVPNYSTVVLPALKEHALECLVQRFSPYDWQSWPKSGFGALGGPTMARRYVDDLSTVNRDLGVFLETAALLLHGLHSHLRYGRPYELDQGMNYVIENAETLLANRANSAVPARLLLLPSIVVDPAFISTFEKERGRLTADYMRRNPGDVRTQLELVKSLRAKYCPPDMYEELAKLVQRLVRDGSPKLRRSVIETSDLRSFAASDHRVSQTIAELYATAAVDALEQRDQVSAQKLVGQSASIYPGLKSQQQIRRFLSDLGSDSSEPAAPEVPAEPGLFSSLLPIVIGLIVVAGAVMLLLPFAVLLIHKRDPALDDGIAEDPAAEGWRLDGGSEHLPAIDFEKDFQDKRRVANSAP